MAQLVGRFNNDQFIEVRNTSGTVIPALRFVKASSNLHGFQGIQAATTGDQLIGITLSSSTNQQKVHIATGGSLVQNLNTASWQAGTLLYCGALGELTSTPTGKALATVVFSDYTNGKILLLSLVTYAPLGITSHSELDDLDADDHSQYHNDIRGDARYYTKTLLDAGQLDNRYYTESELDAGQLDTRYYTETEVDTLLSAKQNTSEKAQPNGYASLDGAGKIPTAQLPSLAIVDVYVVADIPARDALVVQSGDLAKVIDNGLGLTSTYVYDGASWVEITTDGLVDSVNGQIGNVSITLANITGTLALSKGGTGYSAANNTDLFNYLDPLTAAGQLIVNNGTDSVALAAPYASNLVLRSDTSGPLEKMYWGNPPAGGLDTNIQFNSSGNLAGQSTFWFDSGTTSVILGTLSGPSGKLHLEGQDSTQTTLYVKGAPSQSAYGIRYDNSSGTLRLGIDNNGRIYQSNNASSQIFRDVLHSNYIFREYTTSIDGWVTQAFNYGGGGTAHQSIGRTSTGNTNMRAFIYDHIGGTIGAAASNPASGYKHSLWRQYAGGAYNTVSELVDDQNGFLQRYTNMNTTWPLLILKGIASQTADNLQIQNSSGTNLFTVSSSGDLTKIKNVNYVWPSSNSAGSLYNDGSGNLSWSSATRMAITYGDAVLRNSSAYTSGTGTVVMAANKGYVMPRAGCILSHSVNVNIITASAGDVTFNIRINGIGATTTSLSLPFLSSGGTGTKTGYVSVAINSVPFAAGDLIAIAANESIGGSMEWDESLGFIEIMFFN